MNDGDGKIVGGGGIGMVSWKCVIGNKMIGAVWGACFVNSALEVKVGGCLGVRRPIFVFSLQIFTFRQNPLLMCRLEVWVNTLEGLTCRLKCPVNTLKLKNFLPKPPREISVTNFSYFTPSALSYLKLKTLLASNNYSLIKFAPAPLESIIISPVPPHLQKYISQSWDSNHSILTFSYSFSPSYSSILLLYVILWDRKRFF